MGLAIFAVPVAVAGIFGASEFLLSKNSKWTALAEKYRLTGAGPTHWNAPLSAGGVSGRERAKAHKL